MKIDIGILPHKYVSKNNSGGLFPFVIYNEIPYLIHVGFFESENEKIEKFVFNWMNKLDCFPIYGFYRCFEFQQEEFEEECSTNSIEYTRFKYDNNDFYNKVKIYNIMQFDLIFPYIYGNGCMNNFASWSLNEDIYSIEKRDYMTIWGKTKNMETPIVTLNEDTTLFWVDYDGNGLVVISNDKKYSKLSLVVKDLPNETDYSIAEFSE